MFISFQDVLSGKNQCCGTMHCNTAMNQHYCALDWVRFICHESGDTWRKVGIKSNGQKYLGTTLNRDDLIL